MESPKCPMSLPSCLMLLCIATCFIWNPVSGAEVCKFPAIFNIGDSNDDTGGYVAAGFFKLPPPYGQTFFNRSTGRFTDGRLIIDFIAQSLGLPFLSAYLNSVGANYSHGVNFAATATTITYPPPQRAGSVGPFYLAILYQQFTLFKANTQFVRQQGGLLANLVPSEESFSKGLYIFDLGQTDLAAGFFGVNKTLEQVNASVPDIISTYATNITSFYQAGARYFWILNTGPIGCLPYITTNFATERDEVGCAKPHNEVALYFDIKLREAVAQLRKDLPLANITLIDIYGAKYDLFLNATKYGFEKPLEACCGYGGQYNFNPAINCGDTIVVNGTEIFVGSCDRPWARISWDGVHYTEAANKFIFDRISTGAFSDPPLPFNASCWNY